MKSKKPCKGINKAKHVPGCGEIVNAKTRKYGLCWKCYGDFLLHDDVGKAILDKAILKASKPRLDLQAYKDTKKQKKSLTTLLNNVRNVFHEYIRLRDKGKPCISSGIAYKSDFQAGHYYKAELYPTLRFDEDNVHGQSVYDNCLNDGNFAGYTDRLPGRIGRDRFEALQKKAEADKKLNFKWDREELNKIRKLYQSKIKELKRK